MGRSITLLCWNFEANGGADSNKLKEANQLLASLHPDLLYRQEMWGADAEGKSVMASMEEDLALRGWLGPSSHTAVSAATSWFGPVRPPTARAIPQKSGPCCSSSRRCSQANWHAPRTNDWNMRSPFAPEVPVTGSSTGRSLEHLCPPTPFQEKP
ncbi:hypothetical protein [Streptomyces sp. NPDC015125]|uniref:hypothetical protein n=1 Tax=Streptomyces sp. NPDC015125 TaxID=3364938 RepID=UPI0036FDD2C9